MDIEPSENKLNELRLRATQTLQLIGLVEANPVLYNSPNKNTAKTKSKSLAWRQITGVILGIKPEEVTRLQSLQIQHKWKSLRTAYVRQKKKANPLMYRYADLMGFLDPYIKRDETVTSFQPNNCSTPFEIDLGEAIDKSMEPEAIQNICVDFFDPIEEDFTSESNILETHSSDDPSILSSGESTVAEAMIRSAPKRQQENYNQTDELDGFFLQISRTVRKFSPRKIIELKMQIFNVVSQAELDELDVLKKF